ncbi:uncharacterized protein K02A2.6-like [Aedes albopictus]|uniref:Integrase catalytic domain-containing protein n=1 Tax=Aedes albopictus TaxID=7160 RepID=A0ABM1ZD63_AEDAL
MDFLGPLPSNVYLLVIVDYYSRYKEVCIMKRITSEETIKQIEPIFVRLGYPRTITLDNGRQFISTEFEDYCRTRNITLNHTAPYWPQANGEVERQNSSLLKRLEISHWETDLLQYSMMYNTTAHSITGKAPSVLLQNRLIRSKIPTIGDKETAPPVSSEAQDRDIVLKHKGKEREDIRRHAKPSEVQEGDNVLLKNLVSTGKLTSTFGRTEYNVVERKGNRVTVFDPVSGGVLERNTAHVKQIAKHPNDEVSRSRSGTSANIPSIPFDVSTNLATRLCCQSTIIWIKRTMNDSQIQATRWYSEAFVN